MWLGSRWKSPSRPTSVHPPDSIEHYLGTPTVDEAELKAMGGVMMYWYRREESSPDLS